MTRGRRNLAKGWLFALCLAILLLAGLAVAAPAQAATISVTTTTDEFNMDGDCSLREAIESANDDFGYDECTAGNGADIVQVPAGTYGVVLSVDGDAISAYEINEAITIQGPAAGIAKIDGNDLYRVFQVNVSSTLRRLTIEDGNAIGAEGGAIRTGAALTVENCVFLSNRSQGNTTGGAIHSSGASLTVTSSTFTNNTTGSNANPGANGGAIAYYGTGSASITDSRFTSNSALDLGGAIANAGTMTLTDVSLGTNSAGGHGGAIYNRGTLTLRRALISNNDAGGSGGGVYAEEFTADATTTLRDSWLVNNDAAGAGGAIRVEVSLLVVEGTTVSGNDAGSGHGVSLDESPTASLSNVTISGNGAALAGSGGGLHADDTSVDLSNITFDANAANTGGNIWANFGQIEASNVLMGDDAGGGNCSLGAAVIVTSNSIEEGAGAAPCGFDQSVADADIEPLADNGGPEVGGPADAPPTNAIQADSEALNSGSDCAATDQRGVPRPQGGGCDVGAYERALCRGTLVNRVGSPSGERLLYGTDQADGFLGLGADETIEANAGNDHVCAGLGDDLIYGGFPGSTGDGADLIVGGGGLDEAHGGAGGDDLEGGGGADQLLGGAGADDASGGAGADSVAGNAGNDDLFGNGGPDKLAGGPDKDDCSGGPGTDSSTGCETKTGIP